MTPTLTAAPKPAPAAGPITMAEALSDIAHRHLQVADYGKADQLLVEDLHRVWAHQLKPRIARADH